MAYNKGRKKFHRKRKKIEDPPGLAVNVYNNNIEVALRRFKKKVKNSNLMLDLRKKTYYEKPSEIKRRKKKEGIKNFKKKMKKLEQIRGY